MLQSGKKKLSNSSTFSSVFEFEENESGKEKSKVCFGSGLERKLLDSDTRGMVSRHARQYMRQQLDTAPGMYEIQALTSALSKETNKPTSTLGTVLGGRKAERMSYKNQMTPAPGVYNIPTFPIVLPESCIPFDSTTERKMNISDYPGVGTYRLDSWKRRRIFFKHTFGGPTCLQPSVKTKCGPFNFDKCERCQKFPEGDYWYLEMVAEEASANPDGVFLCRPCYEIEKKELKLFNFGQFQRFKKIRDCSKIHFHDGCVGKLFLVPPQEISKLKEREAYLSLYFN